MSRFWEVWNKEHVDRLVTDTDGWANEKTIRRGPIVRQVLSEIAGGSVLDIGCGVGRYATFLRDLPVSYRGYDSSEDMLAVAKQRFPDMSFNVGDIYDLNAVEPADTVIAIAVLVHLPDVEKALRSLWSRARKCLIVTVRMRDGGMVEENRTYKWSDKGTRGTTNFPKGKRLIVRSEDPTAFEGMISSLLGVKEFDFWPVENIVVYKISKTK